MTPKIKKELITLSLVIVSAILTITTLNIANRNIADNCLAEQQNPNNQTQSQLCVKLIANLNK